MAQLLSHPDGSFANKTWKLSSLAGPSVLYLGSAACVLYGMNQVLTGNGVGDAISIAERFAGVGAIHVYQLALFLIAMLLVCWRRVLDDAVSLTLLVGAFLVGAAATLDTISAEHSALTMAIGGVGLLMGITQLWFLTHFVIKPINIITGVSFGALLAWNFLMPAVMGEAQLRRWTNSELHELWFYGWAFTLLAGGGVVAGMIVRPARELGQNGLTSPFLRSHLMGWTFAGMLVLATFAHQWALTWAFFLTKAHFGDAIPAVVIIVLILMEACRALHGKPARVYRLLLGFIPLTLAGIIMMTGYFSKMTATGIGWVSFPPISLFAMAGVTAWLGWRWFGQHRRAVAWIYLFAALLSIRALPGHDVTHMLDWWSALIAVFAGCIYMTVRYRWELTAVMSAGLLVLGAVESSILADTSSQFDLPTVGIWLIAFGFTMDIWALWLRNRMSRLSGAICSAGLAIGLMMVAQQMPIPFVYRLMFAACLVLWTALIAKLARQQLKLVAIALPIVIFLDLMRVLLTGWGMVASGFTLLLVGTIGSLIKSRRLRKESA